MKRFILFLLFLTTGYSIKAQSSVTIPDPHFVNWLTVNIPSAMSGNQLDTNNAAVLSLTSMDVSSDTICDLDGIRYFKSLKTLNCAGNKLDTLLDLPDSLQTLICSGNRLIYLLEIPDSVKFFDCAQNQLDSLPVLPFNLLHFDCHNNSLNGLDSLPVSIIFFDCSGNQLTVLPALPPGLPALNCAENQLTSLPALPSTITTINCEHNMLSSLPALPLSLTMLNCGVNQLSALPALPSSLIELQCYQNVLTSLPALPASLMTLVCGNNQLTALPLLPGSLVTLKCYINQLAVLPALPGSLQFLDCSNNILVAMPSLSVSLLYLDCSINQLTALPALNSLLQNLHCSNNQLPVLPALPLSLNYLNCAVNPLLNLPSLPAALSVLDCNSTTLDSLPALPASLSLLNCSGNSLTALPALSGSLAELHCDNNLLTNLPVLPSSLQGLVCNSNNINCFEELPASLLFLEISGNPFTCLPNYLPVMDAPTLAYPLCVSGDTINNSGGCPGADGVFGFTYTDRNSSCIMDATDMQMTNIAVQLFDSSGVFIGQTYTAVNGVYHFPRAAGIYEVRVDTIGIPVSPQCTSPGVDSTVVLTLADPLAENVNFGFNCKPGFDVGVRSIAHNGLVFPGQTHELKVDAGDMTQWYNMACAAGLSGQVQMTVNGPVTFSGIPAGALTPVVAGSTYTYSIADFASIVNTEAFGLLLTVDPTAGSGNPICVEIDVTPGAGDNDTANNSFRFCYEVVNSYDPNMKETYPENIPLNYDGWITYTIHFQNTGNAPAININLKDTLDSQLDISTFEAIGYSHANNVIQNGNMLLIQFRDIYLSDSTTHADSSKGYFQYRIKPLPGLSCGSEIHNTASIYFDFNAPVVTNTTTNLYPAIPEAVSLSDTVVCYGSSLTINTSSPGNTINWYNAGSLPVHSGNSYTLTGLTSSTGLYAQVVSSAGCSSNHESMNVSVLPSVSSPLLSVSDTVCFTDSLSLSASAVSGWDYHWSGPSGFVSSLEDPAIASLSQSNSGMYMLYLSNGQCLSDTADVHIKVDVMPEIFVTNNPYICLGENTNLHVYGNVYDINWTTGESEHTITVAPLETTLYSVDARNTCGTTTQNILVTVNQPPTAVAPDAVLLSGESTPLAASGGVAYAWYPQNGLSCSDCSAPLVSITESQNYSVIVTDIHGCSDTTELFVKVEDAGNSVYVPNSFSPNGDGLNDEFKLAGNDIGSIRMIIYARSGDKIFESTDVNAGWDGTYKGKTMGPSVYIFTLSVTFVNGEQRQLKGYVTLIE